MTAPESSPLLKRVARKLAAPAFSRIDAARQDLEDARRSVTELAIEVERLTAKVERLEAFGQVNRAELAAEVHRIAAETELAPADAGLADAVNYRVHHAMLHTDAVALELRAEHARDTAELKSTARLAQAMAERAIAGAASGPAATGSPVDSDAETGTEPAPVASVPAAPARFEHAVPTFDPLYRAFEDRHRGSLEAIRDRQREDYLELLSTNGDADLPVVDLGCGRGELVSLLDEAGVPTIGVDSNLGQVADTGGGEFVEADLFDWLDQRADGSCRSVVAMHVIEHVPLELQIRLFFEARRVLADGGVLVVETPNTFSISTAATNFWIDPTHLRPVHPQLMEFLAAEAGFAEIETRPLHPLPVEFSSSPSSSELAADLNSLIFGCGDMALVARR